MHIEINGDAEKLIRAGLASGEFQSAEELIAAMARAWVAGKSKQADLLPRMTPSTDIRDLVAKQGVRPFDPAAPGPDFWPPDESADEFLTFLQDARRGEPAHRKRM